MQTPSRRIGITLVEVMVALVLVAVGLLGIAGSSALLLRAAAAQSTTRRATRLAQLRVARLSATGCTTAPDGTAFDSAAGISERWHLSAPRNGALTVDDSLEWTAGTSARRLVVRTALLC